MENLVRFRDPNELLSCIVMLLETYEEVSAARLLQPVSKRSGEQSALRIELVQSIKEEMGNARKTTKVFAKNIQAADAVDSYSDGPRSGSSGGSSVGGPPTERQGPAWL